MRPNEYEAGRRGYFCIGAAVLANEDETCSSVHEDKSDRRTRPSFHRSHSDVEKFTDWLIKVLQSQLRTNFGRRRRKAAFLRARVDVRQRRFTRHAKLGSGHNDEVKVEFDRISVQMWAVQGLLRPGLRPRNRLHPVHCAERMYSRTVLTLWSSKRRERFQ